MTTPADKAVILVGAPPVTQQLLRDRCRTQGIRLLTAATVADARRSLREMPIGAIIVDVTKADSTGGPIEAIADDASEAHVPSLAITRPNSTRAKLEAFRAGALDALAQPFDLTEFMARLANACERSRLTRMLESRSHIDALTGLWNRAHFDTRLDDAVAAYNRDRVPFALLMADLDHFKSINDTYGHRFGDAVLQRFANVLADSLRSNDTAFRYGGEEFAAILSGADEGDAWAAAERVRLATETLSWGEVDVDPDFSVTCSIGITVQPGGERSSAATWIDGADTALYVAKRAGRNQVRVFEISRAEKREPGTPPARRLAG